MQDSHTIPSTAYIDVGIVNLSTRSNCQAASQPGTGAIRTPGQIPHRGISTLGSRTSRPDVEIMKIPSRSTKFAGAVRLPQRPLIPNISESGRTAQGCAASTFSPAAHRWSVESDTQLGAHSARPGASPRVRGTCGIWLIMSRCTERLNPAQGRRNFGLAGLDLSLIHI